MNMENKNYMNIISPKMIFGILILIGLCAWIIKPAIHDKRFSDARNSYKASLLEIENYEDKYGIIKSINVDTDFYDYGDGKYYSQVDLIKITVPVSDDLESMPAKEVCEILHIYQTDIEEIMYEKREESGYEKILGENTNSSGYIKYKGRYANVENDYDVNFVSSNYEYSFYPRNFYITKKNLGGSTEYGYEFEENTLTYFGNTEKEKKGPELPYVGMSEEYLNYTSLGKADTIEKCRDFDALVPRARSKTYKWEKTSEHGWYKITVSYRKHFSHRADDYVDLPASNGFVSSITYYDENGQMKTDYYHDTY